MKRWVGRRTEMDYLILFYMWTDSAFRWAPSWPNQVNICGFGHAAMGFTRLGPLKTVPGVNSNIVRSKRQHGLLLRSRSGRQLLSIEVQTFFAKKRIRKLGILNFGLSATHFDPGKEGV